MEPRFFQLNDTKMFADVTEGTAIVINSMTGIYYGMNGFGTSIYENLQAGSSDADILSAVAALPGAPADFAPVLEKFIAALTAYEILVPAGPGGPRPAEISAECAQADGFDPVCTEYQDVQELLFADPIHEVDAEEGWKPE